MTHEEFRKLKEDFIESETKMWKNNIYLDGKKEKTGYGERYMDGKVIEFSLMGLSVDDLIKVAKDGKEYYEENKWRPTIFMDTGSEVCDDYESGCFVEDFFLYASYLSPMTEEIFRKNLKIYTRQFITELMYPDSEYPKSFSCEMLKLFEDEVIDWDTFKRITDAGCEI